MLSDALPSGARPTHGGLPPRCRRPTLALWAPGMPLTQLPIAQRVQNYCSTASMARGKGSRRSAAQRAGSDAARLDRAAERQHLQAVCRQADQADEDARALRDLWTQFQEEIRPALEEGPSHARHAEALR